MSGLAELLEPGAVPDGPAPDAPVIELSGLTRSFPGRQGSAASNVPGMSG